MWYACAIATNCRFDPSPISKPFELAAGVYIEPVPEWVNNEDAFEHLSWRQREDIVKAQVAFSVRYSADALGSPDPDWKGSRPMSVQAYADEKFALAALALWLVKPSNLSCGIVLHFNEEGDPHSIRRAAELNAILINEGESENVITRDDLQAGGKLLAALLALPRDNALWTTIYMTLLALRERRWELRYLLQWVALEALLGSESPNETTFRLSQRIGLFLGKNSAERRTMFKSAREGYGWRSKIAHGGRLGKLKGEQSAALSATTEDILRRAFVKVLADPNLIEVFCGSGRENFLEELAFRD